MPKKRKKEHSGLPSRWIFQHGKYYYCVPKGLEHLWSGKKLYPLGKTLPDAYREFANHAIEEVGSKTVGQLLDRYSLQVIPMKAKATQPNEFKAITKLRATFGHMPINSLLPKDLYKYADMRGSLAQARFEIKIMKHAYTKGVEWGYIDRNPFHGQVRIKMLHTEKRYVEDWEIIECLKLKAPADKGGVAMIQAYIALKLLIGLRKTDMLLLKTEHMKEDGIHVTPQKTMNSTGNRVIFRWTDALRDAVALCVKSRPVDISPYIFCTERGVCYVSMKDGKTSGFDSMWQRFMARAIKETKIKTKFSERDLRRKAGSDAESLERASEILRHSSTKTTRQFYRVKPDIINPSK